MDDENPDNWFRFSYGILNKSGKIAVLSHLCDNWLTAELRQKVNSVTSNRLLVLYHFSCQLMFLLKETRLTAFHQARFVQNSNW